MIRRHAVVAFAFSLFGLVLAAPSMATAADDVGTDYGRMLLLLDSSGSMAEPASDGGTTKIAAAKAALDTVIDDLPDDAYVGLRVYGAQVFSKSQPGACRDSQLVVPPGTDNRDELHSALTSYQPYGETPIGYALQQAARDIGAEGTRSVVLVSDGEATCAPDPCKVAAQLAEKGVDLQIDVVGLAVSGTARDQLRCIAAKGNGSYYDADSADEITDSLQTASDRAIRPFELEGTPIEGGPTSLRATSVTPGRWVDTVGATGAPNRERWFAFDRTIPGSTVSFGVSSLGSTGADTDYFEVNVVTEDGTSCGIDNDLKQINSAILLGAGLQVGPETVSNDECLGQRLLVKVSRDFTSGGSIGEGAASYALRVVEEPPVTNLSSLPPGLAPSDADYEKPTVAGIAADIEGGDSFGSATDLGDGRFSGSIVPGETQVFKVSLQYGEKLDVQLLTPAMSPALRDRVGFVYGPYADLSIYDPIGIRQTSSEGSSTSGFSATTNPAQLAFGLPEVRYRNREASSATTATVSGDYYIVYAADASEDSYSLPYELRVQVRGSADGQPEFDGDEQVLGTEPPATESASATPSSSPSPSPTPTLSSDASNADGGLSTPVKTGLVGALAVIAAICAGAALLLFRRSTR